MILIKQYENRFNVTLEPGTPGRPCEPGGPGGPVLPGGPDNPSEPGSPTSPGEPDVRHKRHVSIKAKSSFNDNNCNYSFSFLLAVTAAFNISTTSIDLIGEHM